MVSAEAAGMVVVSAEVTRTVKGCSACGYSGWIVTKCADDGDAENGPDPYPSEGHFCTCDAGLAEKAICDSWDEGYIRSRMAGGKTREQVLADIAEEDAHIDRMEQRHRFMEVCGLTEDDVVDDTVEAAASIGYTPVTFEDGARAHRVWLCLSDDAVQATDERERPIEDPNEADRSRVALTKLDELAHAMFPNATDWWIAFCNDFTPRIEDEDGNSHEHDGDIMSELDDQATSAAWEAYPAPEPRLDKQFMIEDMLNRHAITDEEAEGLIELHPDDVEGRYIESLTQTGATEL